MSVILEGVSALSEGGSSGPATIDTPLGSDVRFHSMGGIEGLSRAFVYEVDVVSDRSDIGASELLGESVTVHLSVGDDEGDVRHWNGRVTGFEYLDTSDDGDSRYRLTVRPWLWQLTRSADCRIFQQKSIPEIVTQVFEERGFSDYERVLFEDYEQREYVVQYRETDFQFVSRLLERAGIYYFFRHEDGKHTLVLGDSPQAHTSSAGCEEVGFAPDDAHRDATTQYMRRWKSESALETGVYAQSDYDFTKPQVRLFAQATSPDEAASSLQVYDYPGGFDNFADADALARVRLEQSRRDAQRWTGESNARAMTVGSTFALTDHPREDQNRSYLVTWARYRIKGQDGRSTGDDDEPYTCSLVAIEAEVTFRPPLTTLRPTARGPQTAMVVGPSGQEIWTDQYGRVKVQFPWDRQGQNDENSSCWVRVTQAWAGGSFGGQFIPRIGHEVIVDFLEGDPDRPIVTGCVYNASTMPPYDLPGNQTQSGVRSRSTPGGTMANGNEVRFEDAMGAEDLYIQAERTQTTLVKGDQSITIGGNRTLSVTEDDSTDILAGRATTVTLDDTTNVLGVSTLTVAGIRGVQVAGVRGLDVTGDGTRTLGGSATTNVAGNESVQIDGDLTHHVLGRADASIGGPHTGVYVDDFVGRHAGHYVVVVGGSAAPATHSAHLEGSGSAFAAESTQVAALTGLTLTCGQSEIRIGPQAVTISSPKIVFTTKAVNFQVDKVASQTAKATSIVADKVTTTSSGASVVLDSNATAQGAKVELKGGSGGGSTTTQTNKVTTVKAVDQNGEPLALERALVRASGDGGPERTFVLDAKGTLQVPGEDAFDVAFVDCANPDSAGNDLQPYVIRTGDHLSKLAAQRGFDPDAVWNSGKNADLRKKRPDPHILCSGDVIYIPSPKFHFYPCNVGATNSFTLQRRLVTTSLTLAQNGKPIANASCTVHIPLPTKLTTDGDGKITFDAPASQEYVLVEVADPRIVRRMRIGHLDPIDEPSGLVQRLRNGGYMPRAPQGTPDAGVLAKALSAFQTANGLAVTGQFDDATRAKLESVHGC
jgi:type VI secretion system secreted protein VgrG